ncbi:hypothetical protein [Streptomyces griseoaurantiacus]|uniref:hypothetical protein n=1 Tax=Streptomyces griseoaurantiacus TaxID=68213 RepID=UPI0036905A34
MISRRRGLVYAAVLVCVFVSFICAAEFQDTGSRHPRPAVTAVITPPARDTAALDRAREDARRAQRKVMDDASRSAAPWLAP